MASVAPAPFSLSAAPPDLLQAALHISLTGFILFRPLYGPAEPALPTDLAYVYLNPAAQRMLQLPECPTDSLLTLYPRAVDAGVFAFYRDTFLAGQPGCYNVNYQHDGLDNYFQLAAHRAGDLLVVSFSDTADQPRTAVEVALRQSQAREQAARAEAEQERATLRTVFTQAPVGFALFQGADHVVALANDQVCTMLGHPADQLLGRPLLEAVPELRGQGFSELLAEVARTGTPFVGTEMAAELRQPQGQLETHYFDFVYQPIYDAAGSLLGIADLVIDVTKQVVARRQLEQLNQELEARVFERTQALRHAQAAAVAAIQRLRHITDSLPSTSFTADQTGQVLYISPQWYAYTGMALGTSINDVWPTLIHPDDLPAIAREFGAALAEGRAWRYEFRLRGADGNYRWFASQGVPEPLEEATEAGRLRQWFGSNLDIDDLKQAQHAREQQEQLLTTILSALPAGVVTFEGEELRYTFFNGTFQQRVQGRAALGRTVAELFPEAEEQGYPRLLREVLRTGEPYHAHEAPAYVRDPQTGERQQMYLDLAYLPLRHGQEPPHAVLAFSVEVTERVRARQRTETLQAELLATAQRRAQEREAFYQVFEQTPALVQLLRAPGHRIEYVNPAYQQLFPGRLLVGLDLTNALPELREQGFVALLDHVYQTGETYHGADVPFILAPTPQQPARTTYYDFTYQAYRENGQIAGISVFAYDVTEQLLARQERETQRQRLHYLFMQAPAAICILDGPGLVFELVNPGYQALFPGRALHGRPLLEALPEIAGHAASRTFRQVYETGITHEEEAMLFLLVGPDGTLEDRYFNYIQQARFNAQGRPDGVLVFAFEVTQQVRAQQRAERSESRFRQLAETTPMVVWEADAEGQTTYLSPNWEQFTAATNGQGLGWQHYMHPADQAPFLQAWLTAVRTAQPFQAEMRLRVAATGEYRWHLDRAVPVLDATGAVAQWVGAAIDIHEQKLAECSLQQLTDQLRTARDETQSLNQELTAANQQLTRTNVDLDTFIYTASHDLKAPITNIEGLLYLLRGELPAASAAGEVSYILGLMQDSVQRFQHTISHLTDISKLHKEYDQPASAVLLAPVIEGVRLDLALLLQQTGGQLQVDVRAVPTVVFSEKNLRSVIFNLLSNALKYRHPDRPPHVHVRAYPDGDYAVLEVRDNGLGFDMTRKEQVFAMFQRLHTHVEGSGVGLYMVKRVVENTGGKITVESSVGEGTTFAVFLPR